MKKTFLIILALFSMASAEILVMGVDLSEVDAHYIKMDLGSGFGAKIFAYVDYGQGGPERNHIVIDANGGRRNFESEVDVLNIFYKNGWEIKAAITEPSGGSEGSSIYGDTYYILERMDEK